MILNGGYLIQNTENALKKEDNHINYWIHRIDLDIIPQINETKCIGSVKKQSKTIKNIHAEDVIFLITKRNNFIEFFGYTKVDEICLNEDILYDYYESRKKLRLKGIKYFAQPISTKDISQDLNFVRDAKKSANYFKSEYKQISHDDFLTIRKKAKLIETLPSYLEEISMTFKEFMISTIYAVFNLVKHYHDSKQIEINKFLKILKKFLDEYGLKKSFEDIKEFYSRHAVELGFKHVPSRNPDLFVPLYTTMGRKTNFAYISLE